MITKLFPYEKTYVYCGWEKGDGSTHRSQPRCNSPGSRWEDASRSLDIVDGEHQGVWKGRYWDVHEAPRMACKWAWYRDLSMHDWKQHSLCQSMPKHSAPSLNPIMPQVYLHFRARYAQCHTLGIVLSWYQWWAPIRCNPLSNRQWWGDHSVRHHHHWLLVHHCGLPVPMAQACVANMHETSSWVHGAALLYYWCVRGEWLANSQEESSHHKKASGRYLWIYCLWSCRRDSVTVCLLYHGTFLFSFLRHTHLLFGMCSYDWVHSLILLSSLNSSFIKL